MHRLLILILALPLLGACMRPAETGGAKLSLNAPRLTTASAARRNDPPAEFDIREAEHALNAYRQKYNLPPLTPNPVLMKTARAHARDLAFHNKVSHTGSDGLNPAQRLTRAGYSWSSVGENVSAGRNSIAEVIQAWHNSPSHRPNLQHRLATEFGMAVVHNPKSTLSNYWVLLVAAPKKKSGFNLRIGG
ncbi:MAG TPA: CAP domain-containing protein [Rhizobiales bacterium]|nr:CAP domain-containing protein [Hyphomicrobiales bacterium]